MQSKGGIIMTPKHDILQVTPRVEALAALCRSNSRIDPALYRKYDVKRCLLYTSRCV